MAACFDSLHNLIDRVRHRWQNMPHRLSNARVFFVHQPNDIQG
jgi:hypothetical protein